MSTKRKLFAGLASLTLFDIAAASAAEPPAVYNWAGLYVGAHAGYRWADAQFTSPGYVVDALPVGNVVGRSNNLQPNGGIVGAHLGYNYMLSPTLLAGIEGDWTWGSGRASVAGGPFDTSDGVSFFSSQVKLTWQATIRGRLGLTNGPWLIYATGGVAFINVKWNDTSSYDGAALDFSEVWAQSKIKTGWTVGGGIERMLNPNWIARLEYLYENFGSFNVPHGLAGPQLGKLELDAFKLRVGISYKFDRY
jgi:opacity protein-like surface antigen